MAIETGLVGDHCILVLELLEGLSGLQDLIEEPFDEGRRLDICDEHTWLAMGHGEADLLKGWQ